MALPALVAQRQMAMFVEGERPIGFLSSFYRVIEGSTGSTGKTVTWDAVRDSQQIAGTVSPGTGMRINTADRFTTKEITPARYGESVVIDVNDLVNRMAGENPFAASNRSFASRFTTQVNNGLVKSAKLIDRSVELNAAQVLQTGEIDLDGSEPYAQDFFPKSTHFPTAAVLWSDKVNAKPLDDLEVLCDVVQTDSKAVVNRAIFGRTALREFLATEQVQETDSLRRTNLLAIDPRMMGMGATRYGVITVGQFEIELWAYNEKHEPVGGGTKVPYVGLEKVILMVEKPNLVVVSTLVPRVIGPDPRLSGFVSLPTKSKGGWDLVPNIYSDNPGDVIAAGFYASVVLLPQAVDELACLST